jgi:hypothetical protein
MAEHLDKVALVAGLLVAAFGVVLLLDTSGDLNLRFAALPPIAALMGGATLLTAGLTRRD